LNYGFRFFESKQLYAAGAKVTTARVWKGNTNQVDIGVADTVSTTVPRGKQGLKTSAELKKPLVAPLAVGQVVGTLIVNFDGAEIARAPLVVQHAVGEGPWWSRLLDTAKLYFE
jgi:serine-type D-Ala-D-Ala carboxypeptidase (penicillin-binding protein 5/6)